MIDHEALSGKLAGFAPTKKARDIDPAERRLITGFEDIVAFAKRHGRAPQNEPGRDIFERMYATRLKTLQAMDNVATLLEPLDELGILAGDDGRTAPDKAYDHETLAAKLKGFASGELEELKHVRSSQERREAQARNTPEMVAQRDKCPDFDQFRPIFKRLQADLDAGVRQTVRFEGEHNIDVDRAFILDGLMAYVAEKGKVFLDDFHKRNARLRVIFDNGTESNLLMRSLQRALYKDEAGRRITEPNDGPLFSGQWEDGDIASGTIYVLRSESDDPYVAKNRQLIHKIGVTCGDVQKRIAPAATQTTYLLADVELIATYTLVGIHPGKMERLVHQFFADARLDLTLEDRFGNPKRAREWFLVPFHCIEAAIEHIREGDIDQWVYDSSEAAVVKRR